MLNERERPNYMGVFETGRGVLGIFFMFIGERREKGLIAGIIQDNLGLAHYDGKITSENIRFDKNYFKRVGRIVEREEEIIVYKGTKVEGGYTGEYEVRDEAQGKFFLEKYAPSVTLDAVVEKMVLDNGDIGPETRGLR